MRELKPDELRAGCDPAVLPFKSTEELAPLEAMIGRGVLIPEANGEGLQILSGRPAGERAEPGGQFPDGSFNAAVERALAENVERLKALRTNSHGEAATRSGSG
jgi:hypothetical protein